MTQFKYLAQSAVSPTNDLSGIPIVNLDSDDVYRILIDFANWMFIVFVLVFVVLVLFAAFRFLTASGNESKIKDAYKAFWFAIVALVIALLATGIVALVNQLIYGSRGGVGQPELRWACYDPETGRAIGGAIGEAGLDNCNANCPRDCALCEPDGGVDCEN